MRNHNGKKNSSMMWMMLICILPLVVLLFAGGKVSSGGYLWPILIGVFVIAHLVMMFKGHGGHNDANMEEKSDASLGKQPETKDEHKKDKHGGCCY